MPTYDYRCQACDHRFEQFQSMTADPLRKCPQCGKNELERLIGTGAGVIFKGSGFYQTDYRGSSYSADQKKDEGKADGGGCSKACGTPDAPAGCAMGKSSKAKKA